MKHRVSKGGGVLRLALVALIMTVILCAVFSAIVYFLNIGENAAQAVVFGIMILSVLVSAFLLAKSKRRAGLVNGLLMSVVYFLVLTIISTVARGKISFGMNGFLRFVVLAAAGMLGGILGVNM